MHIDSGTYVLKHDSHQLQMLFAFCQSIHYHLHHSPHSPSQYSGFANATIWSLNSSKFKCTAYCHNSKFILRV